MADLSHDYTALLEAQAAHSNTLQGLRADVKYQTERAERAEDRLAALQQALHIDARILEHLRAGDGTLVLAEHTADGVALVFAPNVAALRDMLLADLHRVEAEAMVPA